MPTIEIPALVSIELEIWIFDWLNLQVLKITLLEVKGWFFTERSLYAAFIFAETCILESEFSHIEVFCALFPSLFLTFPFHTYLAVIPLWLSVVVDVAVVILDPLLSFLQAYSIMLEVPARILNRKVVIDCCGTIAITDFKSSLVS